jgi:hypothetical protein
MRWNSVTPRRTTYVEKSQDTRPPRSNISVRTVNANAHDDVDRPTPEPPAPHLHCVRDVARRRAVQRQRAIRRLGHPTWADLELSEDSTRGVVQWYRAREIRCQASVATVAR